MKATGIVRRIDDLGRIVIPKEIRRTLHIRESDPLEIFTDREGQVILKKRKTNTKRPVQFAEKNLRTEADITRIVSIAVKSAKMLRCRPFGNITVKVCVYLNGLKGLE